MVAAATITPHVVAIKHGRIILDHDGEFFRVLFQFQTKEKRGKYSCAKPELLEAVTECFRGKDSPYAFDHPYDRARELVNYIYSTPWGDTLPR